MHALLRVVWNARIVLRAYAHSWNFYVTYSPRCHAVPLMVACAYFNHTVSNAALSDHCTLAVNISDICTAERTYNQYGQCQAGCNGMYDLVILTHCIARFTKAASLAPVSAYDRQRPGQTQGVKMSIPSRESVSHYKEKRARNPRASRGGPTLRSSPCE